MRLNSALLLSTVTTLLANPPSFAPKLRVYEQGPLTILTFFDDYQLGTTGCERRSITLSGVAAEAFWMIISEFHQKHPEIDAFRPFPFIDSYIVFRSPAELSSVDIVCGISMFETGNLREAELVTAHYRELCHSLIRRDRLHKLTALSVARTSPQRTTPYLALEMLAERARTLVRMMNSSIEHHFDQAVDKQIEEGATSDYLAVERLREASYRYRDGVPLKEVAHTRPYKFIGIEVTMPLCLTDPLPVQLVVTDSRRREPAIGELVSDSFTQDYCLHYGYERLLFPAEAREWVLFCNLSTPSPADRIFINTTQMAAGLKPSPRGVADRPCFPESHEPEFYDSSYEMMCAHFC